MLLETLDSISRTSPARIAVVGGSACMSYAQLMAEARRVASFLIAQAGIRPGAVVALCGARSTELVAQIVGVMLSGAAYAVVEYEGRPAESLRRLQTMAPDFVLCSAELAADLSTQGLSAVDAQQARQWNAEAKLPAATADQVAYVLYTSGSTGKPKGVAVTHGNIDHYAAAIADRLGVDRPLRYAHVSTLEADLGNTSLLLSLTTGGTLFLVEQDLRRDPAGLRDYLLGHEIEFLKITPSHWNAVFASMTPAHLARSNLSWLVLGGELLSVALARRILDSGATRTLVNHYGPTETTVGVTVTVLHGVADVDAITASESIPIGRPLGRTLIRVQRDDGSFAATDARGELYIGGPSVAAGYVRDPEQTAQRFVHLDGEAGRFYRTGDHVQIDSHGVLQFLGRVDRQVKVNGYRVELEHIESVLRALPQVADAAVIFPEVNGKRRLVAAFVPRNPSVESRCVQSELAARVPSYMLPQHLYGLAELPRNANGKCALALLQEQLLARIALEHTASRSVAQARPQDDSDQNLLDQLRVLWQRSLRGVPFDDDDDFFDLGADSLDAIELIAEVQVRGHRVSTHAFLRNPTLRGLASAVAQASSAPMEKKAPEPTESRSFSCAQSFFFRSAVSCPDHHNQAVLLSCVQPADVQLLSQVLDHLLEAHPALRTSHSTDATGPISRVSKARRADLFSSSRMLGASKPEAMAAHIDQRAQQLQESISLSDGRLFAAHLFKVDAGQDQLLLIAHHVAVDVISWRILIADISRLYADLQSGRPALLPTQITSFWRWVDHLNQREAEIESRAKQWLAEPARALPLQAPRTEPGNTEAAARTLWLGFSTTQSIAITKSLAERLGTNCQVLMLAALAQSLARNRCTEQVVVDVESHGRLVLDERMDISRTCGWHTSTYPVAIEVDDFNLRETVERVHACLAAVPELGVAYGLREAQMQYQVQGRAHPSAPVCFNFIGEIDFSTDTRFPLQVAPLSIGRARGPGNDRGHSLKFTARLLQGRLVVDLSFPPNEEEAAMRAVLSDLHAELLCLAGHATEPPQLVLEPGTRTGLIGYLPPELRADRIQNSTTRQYSAVLLTGATGYMGSHVLRELLERTMARVYCLVRGSDVHDAHDRLATIFDGYFPEKPMSDFADRIVVLRGDTSQPQFGLTDEQYNALSASTEAVYHFAADTRLFGPEQDFRLHNVEAVKHCIAFAQCRRVKDLHHMSTLAVCGVNPGPEPILFSEDSLDISQEFQNFYEASKHEAELLVRQFGLTDHRGFIYRSGNVTAHSRSGRFQRNAGDNRFVQFLAACVKVGQLPQSLGDPVALSPVDEVATGIVALSLDATLQGGTFHVDTPHELSMQQVFDAISAQGLVLRPSDHASFAELFGHARQDDDTQLLLGHFWAMRRPRNVQFNHDRTLQILRRAHLGFRELDADWLAHFVQALIRDGALDAHR